MIKITIEYPNHVVEYFDTPYKVSRAIETLLNALDIMSGTSEVNKDGDTDD